jgi:hypothetical protein
MRTWGSPAVALALMVSGCAVNFGTMGGPSERASESALWERKLAEQLPLFGHRNPRRDPLPA